MKGGTTFETLFSTGKTRCSPLELLSLTTLPQKNDGKASSHASWVTQVSLQTQNMPLVIREAAKEGRQWPSLHQSTQ
jgi:hypothetical protein